MLGHRCQNDIAQPIVSDPWRIGGCEGIGIDRRTMMSAQDVLPHFDVPPHVRISVEYTRLVKHAPDKSHSQHRRKREYPFQACNELRPVFPGLFGSHSDIIDCAWFAGYRLCYL